MLRFSFILTACLIFQASAQVAIPELSSRVIDEIDLLSNQEKALLSQLSEKLEQDKGSQLVFLLVDTTQPESIEQYSIRAAEQWRVGRKNVDDGVIVVFAQQDRKVRVEVGYGLEGAIPDAKAAQVVRQVMIPQFRRGSFFNGLYDSARYLDAMIRKEDLPAPLSDNSGKPSKLPLDIIFFFIPLMLVLSSVLSKLLGSTMASSLFGGGAFFTALGFLGYGLLGSIVFGLFTFFIIRMLGNGSTKSWNDHNNHWRGGGFGGGRSYGGGSFHGGGGSFGGGGASGSW